MALTVLVNSGLKVIESLVHLLTGLFDHLIQVNADEVCRQEVCA